jgi:hypothetical protein
VTACPRTRALFAIPLVVSAVALGACGGDSQPVAAAPGSEQNPLVARAAETPAGSKAAKEPGFKTLDRGTARPGHRFSPCSLVTQGQASAALGQQADDAYEAPQGPTCIYRSQAPRNHFVTLAVQSGDLSSLRRQVKGLRTIDVFGRRAYCGTRGKPMLYLPLDQGRVLAIAATCGVATRLAGVAVRRLNG